MRKKIAWVTDSTASFSPEEKNWLEENHVYIVPLTVIFGNESYREGIEITTEEFYEKMESSDVSPSTSQPALGDFIALYEKLKEEYDAAVVIHVSGKISGTYSTSVQAAEIVDFPIHSIDSWIGSFPLKFMIRTAIELHKKEVELPKIVDHITSLREKCRLVLLPANLEQLRKSGRVSNFGSIVGNILQIKPIIAFNEGEVNVVQKVRSIKKAEKALFAKFQDAYESGIFNEVAVLYTGDKKVTENLMDKVEATYKNLKVETMPLIPVAGVHTGIGTVGISWIEK